jgi:hypothetical protein
MKTPEERQIYEEVVKKKIDNAFAYIFILALIEGCMILGLVGYLIGRI